MVDFYSCNTRQKSQFFQGGPGAPLAPPWEVRSVNLGVRPPPPNEEVNDVINHVINQLIPYSFHLD